MKKQAVPFIFIHLNILRVIGGKKCPFSYSGWCVATSLPIWDRQSCSNCCNSHSQEGSCSVWDANANRVDAKICVTLFCVTFTVHIAEYGTSIQFKLYSNRWKEALFFISSLSFVQLSLDICNLKSNTLFTSYLELTTVQITTVQNVFNFWTVVKIISGIPNLVSLAVLDFVVRQ